MCNTCDDNQFEIIARAKDDLINATNIEDSPDEMAVIDEFLFRCWQMGWLDAKNKGTCKRLPIKDWLWQCSACGSRHDYGYLYNYCPNCGRKLEDECDLNILKDKSEIEVK